jgi:hypothetical protein
VFFRDLVHVRSKYGLENWAFELKRNGAAKDPKTTYSILPERQLTDEERRAFAELALHDLDAFYAGRSDDGADGSPRPGNGGAGHPSGPPTVAV